MTEDLSKTARIPSTRSSRRATDRSTAARRQRFVAEYLIDHNATRAAVTFLAVVSSGWATLGAWWNS